MISDGMVYIAAADSDNEPMRWFCEESMAKIVHFSKHLGNWNSVVLNTSSGKIRLVMLKPLHNCSGAAV